MDKKSKKELNERFKPHRSSHTWTNGYRPITVNGVPEEYLRGMGACDTKELIKMINSHL